ncbi:MAG: hypothetical protein IPO92_03785, partial [Saprospiraceae bacterium]|nr:hypothetical protein [Saprospiraceae bacterium]
INISKIFGKLEIKAGVPGYFESKFRLIQDTDRNNKITPMQTFMAESEEDQIIVAQEEGITLAIRPTNPLAACRLQK